MRTHHPESYTASLSNKKKQPTFDIPISKCPTVSLSFLMVTANWSWVLPCSWLGRQLDQQRRHFMRSLWQRSWWEWWGRWHCWQSRPFLWFRQLTFFTDLTVLRLLFSLICTLLSSHSYYLTNVLIRIHDIKLAKESSACACCCHTHIFDSTHFVSWWVPTIVEIGGL